MFCLKLQKSKYHITFVKKLAPSSEMIFEQSRKGMIKNMLRLSPRKSEEK